MTYEEYEKEFLIAEEPYLLVKVSTLARMLRLVKEIKEECKTSEQKNRIDEIFEELKND